MPCSGLGVLGALAVMTSGSGAGKGDIMRSDGYVVAVAGATGAVGEVMLQVLEERKFPVRRLKPLASERSVGKRLQFQGEEIKVEQLTTASFEGVDIALFSAGASRSKEFAPAAWKTGAVEIGRASCRERG